ncbi:hypothetical protein DPMN_143906 [Dreissena polymorpha]|uniref:Uncharacterized protein n=1 Tax=Dreissena polymorpha TaxID=45954 RepID=A0A9D4GH65_DREPO|nr:hypothetical protein DPMN_143906 [Dreissena polymorpha]
MRELFRSMWGKETLPPDLNGAFTSTNVKATYSRATTTEGFLSYPSQERSLHGNY